MYLRFFDRWLYEDLNCDCLVGFRYNLLVLGKNLDCQGGSVVAAGFFLRTHFQFPKG